jgi:gentisate 1,2-dioxygenase
MEVTVCAHSQWEISDTSLRLIHEPVSKTLGPSAERIDKGMSSKPRRETASSVYHVIKGKGHSNINGEKFEWKQGDTFCIPSWYRYEHFAGPEDTVYLYRFDDKPMIEALGFYRWEGMDTESLVTQDKELGEQ